MKLPEIMNTTNTAVNWKTNLFFVWLTQILCMAGFSAAIPFLPVYIRDTWGITEEKELGAWMAAFYFFGMLSFCVFIPVWGMLADRYGRKIMLLRAYYIDAVLFPCMLFAPSPFWLIVVRFIISAFTGTVSAAQTLIVTNTPEEHHGFALGTLTTAVWSGNLIGFAAGGVVVHYFGFAVAILSCGGMFLLAGIIAQLFVHETFIPPAPSRRKHLRDSWTGLSLAIWLLYFLILLTAVARRFDDPYIPIMIERIHGPLNTALHTGWISALAALGGVLSGMIIGRLCDRFTPQRVTVPALLLAGVTMFLQGGAVTLAGYSFFRFVNFLSAGGLEAGVLSILSKLSLPERRGAIFGLASSIRMSGILLSTLVSGGIVYFIGVRSIYAVGGALFFLAVPFFWLTVHCVKCEENSEMEK